MHCTGFCMSLQSEVEEPDALYKRLLLEMKGHDRAVLASYQQFVSMAAQELDVNVVNV